MCFVFIGVSCWIVFSPVGRHGQEKLYSDDFMTLVFVEFYGFRCSVCLLSVPWSRMCVWLLPSRKGYGQTKEQFHSLLSRYTATMTFYTRKHISGGCRPPATSLLLFNASTFHRCTESNLAWTRIKTLLVLWFHKTSQLNTFLNIPVFITASKSAFQRKSC